MKYELILFDADDTLFDYNKGEAFALKKSLEEFDINVPFEEVLTHYRVVNSSIWKEFDQKLISADDLKVVRFKRTFERIKADVNECEFSDTYLYNLSHAKFLTDGSEELVKQLSGKCRMAIITNGLAKVQRPRFDSSTISVYMDAYFISEEIGLQKPDQKIFSYALRLLDHTDKSTVLMVGDNLHSDILGGINFGIDTCWLNNSGTHDDSGITPTYEIRKIAELAPILLNGGY